MTSAPAVVVKKGGAFSALFYGIAMIVTTGILSASAVGLYGLRILDRRFDALGEAGEKLIEALPHWQQTLPPVLADAFNDRRAPQYMTSLEIRARRVEGGTHGRQRVLIEVTNRGDEAVSLLTLNLVLQDADGVPLRDLRTFAATPLALSDPQFRGPLYPGMQRRYVEWVEADGAESVVAEVVQLRVFNPTPPPAAADDGAQDAPRGDEDHDPSIN